MSSPSLPAQSLRTKYPGMRAREADVMRRWLKLHEQEYDRFDYNVRIGASRDPGPQYPDYVRTTARVSSQLRMDAVAWKGEQVTLLELKNSAWPSAVQQLALYGAVWAAEHPSLPKPKLLVVCRSQDAGTPPTAAAAGVAVEAIGYSPL